MILQPILQMILVNDTEGPVNDYEGFYGPGDVRMIIMSVMVLICGLALTLFVNVQNSWLIGPKDDVYSRLHAYYHSRLFGFLISCHTLLQQVTTSCLGSLAGLLSLLFDSINIVERGCKDKRRPAEALKTLIIRSLPTFFGPSRYRSPCTFVLDLPPRLNHSKKRSPTVRELNIPGNSQPPAILKNSLISSMKSALNVVFF